MRPAERNRFLHDLYLRQLKQAASAKYVRSFRMRNAAGITDYYLFYAANSPLGLKKMKEAMWKVDVSGEFTSWAIISRRIQEDGSMWLEDHFGSGSMLQRNERVKLAASFWNNIGAGMVIGGMAAAFFLDKPQGTWPKIGIAIVGLVLGWLCYSIASNILTYMHTTPEARH